MKEGVAVAARRGEKTGLVAARRVDVRIRDIFLGEQDVVDNGDGKIAIFRIPPKGVGY